MPVGITVIKYLTTVLAKNTLPLYLVGLLMRLHRHYLYLVEQITEVENELEQELANDDIRVTFNDHSWCRVNNSKRAVFLIRGWKTISL